MPKGGKKFLFKTLMGITGKEWCDLIKDLDNKLKVSCYEGRHDTNHSKGAENPMTKQVRVR